MPRKERFEKNTLVYIKHYSTANFSKSLGEIQNHKHFYGHNDTTIMLEMAKNTPPSLGQAKSKVHIW